ncbi:MAG: hypothetical protein ABEJ36_04175 [Candidatus Nanosalina sp.]
MTENTISTVVIIAAAFIVGVFLLSFVVSASDKVQKELRGGVKIEDARSMRQLIMYDSLIAYNCDDKAGGMLDADGDKVWDDWKTYKEAAQAWPSPSTDQFTFQDLNNSFGGDELNCYGTAVSIGGQGLLSQANPNSREWRNDQEGEHSKIWFKINTTKNSGDPGPPYFYTGNCFWFDQSHDLRWGVKHDSPDAGVAGPTTSGGITDMVYWFSDETQVNYFDPYTTHGDAECGQKIVYNEDSAGYINDLHGPLLSVTMLVEGPGNIESRSPRTVNFGGYEAVRGPHTSQPFESKSFKLCKGTRGFIQTNTGYTDDRPQDGYDGNDNIHEKIPYEQALGAGYYSRDMMPGHPQKEKFNAQNDDQDNSVHVVIVLTEYTCP